MTEKTFYTARELSEQFQCNIMTIYRYIKAKKLKAYKIGKEYRIEKADYDDFLALAQTK
jgi:excisionase family DNA binding protein